MLDALDPHIAVRVAKVLQPLPCPIGGSVIDENDLEVLCRHRLCLEGANHAVETVTGGEGRHNDADFEWHPPRAALDAGQRLTNGHRTEGGLG